MNKMTQLKKLLSVFLCNVLIAAVALFTIGCNDNKIGDGEKNTSETTGDNNPESETKSDNTTESPENDSGANVVGQGNVQFAFAVVDKDGNKTEFTVKTDKKYVGEALQDAGLVEGENGPYGLYVKKVNGITADFDVDGTYWAFYVNDQYALTGIDKTEIDPNDVYMMKVSK